MWTKKGEEKCDSKQKPLQGTDRTLKNGGHVYSLPAAQSVAATGGPRAVGGVCDPEPNVHNLAPEPGLHPPRRLHDKVRLQSCSDFQRPEVLLF